MFGSKLQWSGQVANAINKAERALHAIKLIKPPFSSLELRQLMTSNFYSILNYNSKILQIPTLNTNSKRQLLSASAMGLKLCTNRALS